MIVAGVVVIALVILALVGVAWFYLKDKTQPVPPSQPSSGEAGKTFTVEVTHGDGTKKTFTYQSDEDYVGTVLLDAGLISGDQGQYGLYIKVVDGERAVYEEDGAYWGFFINGEYAATGVDMTPIEDGAVYQLTYTKE